MKRLLPVLVVLAVSATAHAQQPAAGSAAPAPAAGSAAPAPAAAAPAGPAWYDTMANRPIEEEGTFWMPKAVNLAADETDVMFYAVLALSVFFFVAITIAVVYLTWRYRHRPGHKPEPSPTHNDALEITWTIIPTIISVLLFWYGWRSYIRVVTPPVKAVEIQVTAFQWGWKFTHQNGVTDSDLHVPSNTPVRLVMTSQDVLHSFYAPAMRVKQDVVPYRYTYAWFYATKPGVYRLTCAEYCGTSHAQMGCRETDPNTNACLRRAVVVVHQNGYEDLEAHDGVIDRGYEQYLQDSSKPPSDPIEYGKLLYVKKGCNACHTTDGSPKIGPSWKVAGEWGTTINVEEGPVKMDENYVRESIEYPAKKGRPGFNRTMPNFLGQLKPTELDALIAYIKSLKQ